MNPNDLAVYFIMGTENCEADPLNVLENALQAGITMFQFREKGPRALKGEKYEEFARACQRLCKHYHVPFIVNDDVELALKLQADGIHVGQKDMALVNIREQFKGKIIGVSVHNEEEMTAAVLNGADYVGIGPIFETTSKSDAEPPTGVSFIKEIRNKYPNYPIVAIGGITTENSSEIIQAGADGVAVISAICQSSNRRETVNQLKITKKI